MARNSKVKEKAYPCDESNRRSWSEEKKTYDERTNRQKLSLKDNVLNK